MGLDSPTVNRGAGQYRPKGLAVTIDEALRKSRLTTLTSIHGASRVTLSAHSQTGGDRRPGHCYTRRRTDAGDDAGNATAAHAAAHGADAGHDASDVRHGPALRADEAADGPDAGRADERRAHRDAADGRSHERHDDADEGAHGANADDDEGSADDEGSRDAAPH